MLILLAVWMMKYFVLHCIVFAFKLFLFFFQKKLSSAEEKFKVAARTEKSGFPPVVGDVY